MKRLIRLALALSVFVPGHSTIAAERPNILFIAIDDQNDWIGHLGGHPMAKTPNLDRLARRGTTFLNAHVQSPLCNPSRTSLMLGLRPTTTGVYGLSTWFRTLPQWKDRVALPQHFANHGYRTFATGKIYHGGTGGGGAWNAKAKNTTAATSAEAKPEFQVTAPYGGVGTRPPKKLIGDTPMGNNPLMDWGVWPLDNDDTAKGDYQVASWTVEQIKSAPGDRPFFLAAGFFLPHVPCYATQKWFVLYTDDDSVLPMIVTGDRDDTPRFSWYLHWELPEPRLKWLKEKDQWRNLVRSYLACTSFVDAQVGRLLEALDQAGLARNTIVVVWGDHGYHLGEKAISGKNTLWERSTRVPLIFAGPGVKAGQRCIQPAELLDIYPTLSELSGVPARNDLEGISLMPQLKDAATKRKRPAITSHNQGNHGIRSENWRYIRHADGSEELYAFNSPHAPIVPTDAFTGKSRAGGFGDFMTQTDAEVGRILRALAENGFADNTLVIFSADNGPEHYAYERIRNFQHRSSGPLRGLKRDLYEGGHRVPFLVRWPGVVKPGSVSDALISQVDLFATLAAVVGHVLPARVAEDSHDLLAVRK